jgi:hypothetical protein
MCFCYLAHPFFQSYRDPDDEPTTQPVVDEHQDAVYTVNEWKCEPFAYKPSC